MVNIVVWMSLLIAPDEEFYKNNLNSRQILAFLVFVAFSVLMEGSVRGESLMVLAPDMLANISSILEVLTIK